MIREVIIIVTTTFASSAGTLGVRYCFETHDRLCPFVRRELWVSQVYILSWCHAAGHTAHNSKSEEKGERKYKDVMFPMRNIGQDNQAPRAKLLITVQVSRHFDDPRSRGSGTAEGLKFG